MIVLPPFKILRIPVVAAFISWNISMDVAGFTAMQVNYAAPTTNEQSALDKINRFRANPGGELAAMFTESFLGTYDNSQIANLLSGQSWSTNFWRNTFGVNTVSVSMDHFQTVPGTLYSQFQVLSSASALTWNDNLGWSAHQYAVWVEQDAGASPNPHAVDGAPGLGARFTNAGITWTGIAENIAPNWPMNVSWMHMGYVVDWGTGVDGIQSPPGHRNAMLNNAYNQLGIGIVDEGWDTNRFTNVQHLANVAATAPIVYGFVKDENGQRQAGVMVEIRDVSGNVIGTVTTDAIGAYTFIVPSGQTPAEAVFSDGVVTSPAITLGSANGNWFVDLEMIPEPSTSALLLLGICMLAGIRKRK